MSDLSARRPRSRVALVLALVLLPALAAALPATAATTATARAAVAVPAAGAPRAAAPSIAVSGDGVGMYPAFDPATRRYAVTTTAATRGAVTVTAAGGSGVAVRLDGRPVTGPTTLTGLAAGDEVSVLLGGAAYSLFVLPAGFPTLDRTTPDSTLGDLQRGYTLLTLGQFKQGVPKQAFYETAVDANGVPAWVHEDDALAIDLQRQPNGHYSVARTTTEPGRTGWDIVELGRDFEPLAVRRTVGLVDTDDHDAILLPDGRRFLLAYEKDPATGLQDAVIQESDAEGAVLFEWNSADHTVRSPRLDTMYTSAALDASSGDYAHVNSMSLTTDGQLLVSFRHLSSIWKITLTAHDGFEVGAVEWRLGGRDSDFDFTMDTAPGDPAYPSDGTDGGPCAQHTASMLPNGHVLFWDNGSAGFAGPFCVKGSDRYAPAVARPHSRAVEVSLTPSATGQGTAEVVWTYDEPGRYSVFAGSARRQPNGNTVIGWANDTASTATEVSPAGAKLWELVDTTAAPSDRFFTYRATRADVPDWAPPVVSVTSPAAGLRVDQGATATVSFSCTDVGGTSLRTCSGSQGSGARLDTRSPGVHTVTVTATDGAGQRRVVTRRYRVLPASRPDLLARAPGAPGFVGGGRYAPALQTVVVRGGPSPRCTTVRVQNDGVRADRLVLHATAAAGWRTSWVYAGRDVSSRVRGDGFRTGVLAAGASRQLCVFAEPFGAASRSTLGVRVLSATTGVADRLRVKLRP